jgi:hypothetical protein
LVAVRTLRNVCVTVGVCGRGCASPVNGDVWDSCGHVDVHYSTSGAGWGFERKMSERRVGPLVHVVCVSVVLTGGVCA